MDVVERFVRLRREGKSEEAYALLAPGASVGCPWGGMRHGESVRRLLRDEEKFGFKGYLDEVPIEPIDHNTFQRRYRWDRGVSDMFNSWLMPWWLRPLWREVYFVKDGTIQLVTSEKLMRRRSLRTLLTLSYD